MDEFLDPVYKTLDGIKEIALTFDDGPKEKTTGAILDALAQYRVQATFFVVGQNANRKVGRELIRRMLAEGHTVGNHSWSHPNFRKVSIDDVRTELLRTQDVLEELGVETRYVRPPYGARNKKVNRLFRELEMDLVLWDVDPRDWDRKSNWLQEAQKGIIRREDSNLVLHDVQSRTARELPHFLEFIQTLEQEVVYVNEF